ncbi:MAG TPA: extracellular solute-binding protein [Acidimicrobiales bacterium]
MRGHKRSWRAAAALGMVLAVGGSVISGCGGGSGRDTLVIYSGRTSNLIKPLLDKFAEETDTNIDVRYDNSANLALLLDEEGDHTDVDVFLSQSPGAVGFLDEQGRLGEISSDLLGKVPEGDAAADGSWIGLSGRVRTLVYNTDLVDPATLPTSVLDLIKPEYAGKVALAPTNGSFQDFVTVLREKLGEEAAGSWLQAMADGNPPTFNDNTAIVEAVGRGEVPMGLVNHYYAFVAKSDNPDLPVENHFFAPGDYGSTLLVTAASIVKDTDQPEAARKFVEFLLSEEAQKYFASETFEYPLASGVQPNPVLPPLDQINPTRVDLSTLGGDLESTAELIQRSGLSS